MVSVAVCRSLMSRQEHFIRVCLPTYPAAFAHSTCALIMDDQHTIRLGRPTAKASELVDLEVRPKRRNGIISVGRSKFSLL